MAQSWKTSKRELILASPAVMGILNVTPDSFSDGGQITSIDDALNRAAIMIEEGADILDIGGESTRPGSSSVSADEEIARTIPVIRAITAHFNTPISIDTSKSFVAKAAIDAGAEIINDISGLRFDSRIADVAAESGAGIVLMHSRGEFEVMHSQEPLDDIFSDVRTGFRRAIDLALSSGVDSRCIALDIGLGFGKTFDQNLELIAKLGNIVDEFRDYPMLVGASRKSFIGKILGDVPPAERLEGSIAAAILAYRNGARIFRVHDVKKTVAALKVAAAVEEARK